MWFCSALMFLIPRYDARCPVRLYVFACSVILCSGWHSAFAAPFNEPVKTFPEAQCSYRLPDDNWKWGNVNAMQQFLADANTVAGAFKTTGVFVAIRYKDQEKHNPPGPRSFESFEWGLLQTGNCRKLRDGRHLTFKGVPAYQMYAVAKNGQEFSIRLFHANDKIYSIFVVSLDKLGSDEEIEPYFQGFNFTNVPVATQPPGANDGVRAADDGGVRQAVKDGQGAAPALLFMAIIAVVVVLAVRHSRRNDRDSDDDDFPRRRRRRRDDEDEDDYPRRRRRREDRDSDLDDEEPRRRRSREEDDDAEERPRRRRRYRDDEYE